MNLMEYRIVTRFSIFFVKKCSNMECWGGCAVILPSKVIRFASGGYVLRIRARTAASGLTTENSACRETNKRINQIGSDL